ncbi:hypothetical protein Hanom_Chr08g00748281 [Helianthus anomalus]
MSRRSTVFSFKCVIPSIFKPIIGSAVTCPMVSELTPRLLRIVVTLTKFDLLTSRTRPSSSENNVSNMLFPCEFKPI